MAVGDTFAIPEVGTCIQCGRRRILKWGPYCCNACYTMDPEPTWSPPDPDVDRIALTRIRRDLLRFAERPSLVADERAEVHRIIQALTDVIAPRED